MPPLPAFIHSPPPGSTLLPPLLLLLQALEGLSAAVEAAPNRCIGDTDCNRLAQLALERLRLRATPAQRAVIDETYRPSVLKVGGGGDGLS